MNKNIIISAAVALLVTVLTIGGYNYIQKKDKNYPVYFQEELKPPVNNVLYTLDEDGKAVPLDFTSTARKVAPAVVQINVEITSRSMGRSPQQERESRDPFRDFFNDDFFRDFFPRQRPQQRDPDAPINRGMGSGVIINPSGYIVTNNHVVQHAATVEVITNDHTSYEAEVIGTDPSTDLALLKIDEEDLPFVEMVNSDDVQIGEWVLALGNPLSLGSTVTAGIVSAVSRNINIFDREEVPYAIESFIQTDAVINRGNSGGPLVNLNGDIIGINTAIASPTGYYTGYGFAVPSNLVNKVIEDLLKYGEVHRAVLGVQIMELNQKLAEREGLKITKGVYVDSVYENSSAKDAGLQSGDVIIAMDGRNVTQMPVLQEYIARKSPGDKVELKIHRNGKEIDATMTLKGLKDVSPELVPARLTGIEKRLGASLVELTKEEKKDLNIDSGVKVNSLERGLFMDHTNISEGFIITKINDQPVNSVKDVDDILKSRKDSGVLIEGIYPDKPNVKVYEAFGM